MQARVLEVLSEKGRQVYTATPDMSVRTAVSAMHRFNVGALVVVEQRRPVGMLSERDILWRIVHEGRASDAPVDSIMTRNPTMVSTELRVADAMRLMTERRVRHLPVVERMELVGLVSIGDLTKWVTKDLETHVGELASYIHGPYVQTSPSS